MAETSHRSGSQDSDAKPSPRLLEQIAIERKAITRQATYGTFKVESIHGRLFELETYLECIHTQSTKYMYGVFFATVLWPVAWLLSACTFRSARSHQRKDLSIITMLFLLGSATGLTLWLLPIILVAIDGGFQRYLQLAFTSSEFLNLLRAELIIGFFILFGYVYHEISVDVMKYKNDTMKSWHHRHDEVGMPVVLSPEQTEHLQPLLSNAPNQGKDIFIEDILHLLKSMPGWESDSGIEAPDFWEKLYGEPRSFFSKLREHHKEAEQHGLWSLDVYVFWSQYHEKATPLSKRFNVTFHKVLSTASWLISELMRHPVACFAIVLLAGIRAALSNIWTWGVLGGPLLPSEPCPLILSLYSNFVYFLTSLAWLALFYLMVLEYTKQLCQVVLVSAMVDPKMRVKYMQMYLPHDTPEQKHDAERIMCNLPLINLKIATNLNAFWKLREYCTLDRSNERIGMHVLMDLVVFWFTLNLLITLVGLFILKALPPTVPVMVFDLFCFGFLLLQALESAMRVNQYMDDHEQMLKQTRYDMCLDLSQMEADDETPDSRKLAKGFRHTVTLLDQYVSMVQAYQGRDKILLGMEVTPGKLAGSFISIFLALLTICMKLYAMGVFNTIVHNMSRPSHTATQSASFLSTGAALVQKFPQVRLLQKLRSMIAA